jgi:hypothetical protein
MDQHWFGSMDPDLDSHLSKKKPDPDPHPH